MLNHVELYVSDLHKTRVFYDFLLPKLGYHIFQEWEQGFSYRKDNFYLVFVKVSGSFLEIGYHRCRVGLNHLAFSINSSEQLDSLREELILKDVRLLYDKSYPFAGGKDHYALYFEDPDRIKLEIVAIKENDNES